MLQVMQKQVLAAIFITFVTDVELPARVFPPYFVSCYSIKEFVNTHEPIWTYITDKTINTLCKNDRMRTIHQFFISFNRSLLINGERTTHHLEGHFDAQRSDRMTIHPTGRQAISIEQLLYKARDSSCGVIRIKSLAGPKYVLG
ncbi:uncharacterized protein LOC142558027 isoform X2 [Dermacentor variabilis]|uniref:uncharacterized protein LOC142558027 isoform X2 n=1 Tax=Dermacentor variabilis TaxID=34621 RepID=UPI003F5C139F